MALAHPLQRHTAWHVLCIETAISQGWQHLSRDHWVKNSLLITKCNHSFLTHTLQWSFYCFDIIYTFLLVHVKESRPEIISVLFCIYWYLSIQSNGIWKCLSLASPGL